MKTLNRRTLTLLTAITISAAGALGTADVANAAPPAPVSNLAVSSCPAWIQQGQTSGCVTRLQQLLNTKQGARLLVDGIFGSGTAGAVKTWQSRHGLVSDGIVGPATKASIDPAPVSRNQKVVDATNVLMAGTKYLYTWGGGHGPTAGVATFGNQNASGTKKGYGFDCSGFARAAYAKAFGYDKLGGGTAASQSTKGVVTSNPKPGDLIFYSTSNSSDWNTVKRNVGHVAIYMGGGKIAHQSTYGTVQHWGDSTSNLRYAKKFFVHYTG